MTSIIEQQNTIQTTDLDIIPEDDVTKGIKRPAPASDASDTESDVPQEPVKRKKQTTSYNWGALYWQNPNNGYTIVYDEKSKQFNFQTPTLATIHARIIEVAYAFSINTITVVAAIVRALRDNHNRILMSVASRTALPMQLRSLLRSCERLCRWPLSEAGLL